MSPFKTRAGAILLSRDIYGLGRRIQDDDHGTIWRLLGLMDGTRPVDVITARLQEQDPELGAPEIHRAIRRLQKLGIVEDAALAPPAEFSSDELERYSRNFDFFATATLGTARSAYELQSRLKRARVTVLGIGGVGSATAWSLAAAGVGHLRIIDSDRVEASNLNRQLLFGTRDIGRPKVDVAAERLREVNPHVTVVAEVQRAERPSDLPGLVTGCDLFVLGADQPHEILLWANDAAIAEGVPWLENSYNGPRCAIALFVPGRTPCLRCLQHHLEAGLRAKNLAEGTDLFLSNPTNPVLAPTVGVAAHFGALQALYFLVGLPTAAEGRLLALNLWRPTDVRLVVPPFWPDCPACGRRPPS